MSLRKFMHPRNKYKKVPDFKELALLYPEFRKIAITNLAGKVKIDFKNEESLKVLTEVLLKHDFNLNVKVPPNKLVPTLPLRLNYILWIEDLMTHASFNEMKKVHGIDIGTGAICIYPLLITKMYGNQMIGTEVDETSIQTAVENIENNNLQHLIKVLKVNEETILKGILEEDKVYHFTMCNPPFFEIEGMSEKVVKRLPPRNAPTGNETELTVQGGERAFVTQMIEESMEFKERVKIYTTMFGRRSNLLFLLKLLKKKNIENATWTEFCQGHTKRWGLAWSFLSKDIIDLTNAPVIRKSGDYIARLLKEQRPAEIQFPMRHKFSSLDHLVRFLEETMEELHVQIKELNLPIDDFNGWSCQLIAQENTWSYARRKRRLAQRLINQSKENETECTTDDKNDDTRNNSIEERVETSMEEQSVTKQPLLICSFFVEVVEHEESEDDDVKISIVYEKGTGGKNALETFRQYLINKLDVREHFQKRQAKSNKKKRKRLKTSDNEKKSFASDDVESA
ncbi:U6 small nuclear RNA (adenine-(43)-N(6))-methyltransferase [Ceratina calcarata]|uniref:U6 small nuclear RNA (adenine-(43)-N(6))-methyltransferase n=1 Tax=Ceratina calcarata TaxID=156304 RepID=A0AAJ7S1C5_9HYME|nr:U6 small nuclear RNA (adenine-(43)-N(6))-methyltransferase [Ceratina calcarata]XP_026669613.1 U6 small nuclear RNA (adenine-(43)-N(6))-methyltransferase [Ceratina calcarata]